MPKALAFVGPAWRRCAATLILLFLQIGIALAASADNIHLAAAYCANESSAATLSNDGMIFCFDGPIGQNVPIDLIAKLNDGGFFVVRSPGGAGTWAMKMADVLMAKHAAVARRSANMSRWKRNSFGKGELPVGISSARERRIPE